MGTKARILADLHLDDAKYKPNQVVEFEASLAKRLAAAGQIDTDKAAVAYCLTQLGAEVVVHGVAEEAPADDTTGAVPPPAA